MFGVSDEIALYIHIPFCARKCGYCSFASYQERQMDIPLYLDAIKAEMRQRADARLVTTIFFGGGTPSLLSPNQVGEILKYAHSVFDIAADAEITIEANPGTVDSERLAELSGLGVNRLSLGVQSFKDDELRLLGRIHTAAEAKLAVEAARSAGFENINIDLIYGLPFQGMIEWRENLAEAMALETEHLSLYALTLEDETPMCRAVEQGKLPEQDPDFCAAQYEEAEQFLAANGYRHYEISNWSKPGFECRHNLAYWLNKDYIGIGVGAHSSLANRRTANTESLDQYLVNYLNGVSYSPEMEEYINRELKMAETIILGLRLDDGVNIREIGENFGLDATTVYNTQIAEMTNLGMLESFGELLKLTPRGRLMSNEVFWRFLPEESAAKAAAER